MFALAPMLRDMEASSLRVTASDDDPAVDPLVKEGSAMVTAADVVSDATLRLVDTLELVRTSTSCTAATGATPTTSHVAIAPRWNVLIKARENALGWNVPSKYAV